MKTTPNNHSGIQGDKSFKRRLAKARSSPIRAYMDLTVGDRGFGYFLLYELVSTLASPMPGAAGYFLRKLLFPRLLGSHGPGLMIGRNVILRNPGKIDIGANVTIDDDVLIDARGDDSSGVILSDGVNLGRGCVVKAKTGGVRIGRKTNVGGNTTIVSYAGIQIGESVLIAGSCHINAGGYQINDITAPMMQNGIFSKAPITIGDDVWIGTGAIVLDATTIGSHSVVGAGAVVTRDVPEYTIVGGVPARPIRDRRKGSGKP